MSSTLLEQYIRLQTAVSQYASDLRERMRENEVDVDGTLSVVGEKGPRGDQGLPGTPGKPGPMSS